MIQNNRLKPTKKGISGRAKRYLFIWGMLALPLLQWLIFFVYVNINSVLMAFQKFDSASGVTKWSLDNFPRFVSEFGQTEIKVAVKNSVLAGVNNLVLVLISLILSYFFYKKIPGRVMFRIIYFLPSVISIVIYTLVYKSMFDTQTGPLSLLLQRLGITLENLPHFGSTAWSFPLVMIYCLWVGTGYNIIIFGAAMEGLPDSVMEYSRLEGVGMMRELFTIVIPMIWSTIVVAILGCITVVFTLFIQVQLLTQGTATNSQTIAYVINSVVLRGTDLEFGAAQGVFFTVIAAPIIIIIKKGLDKIGEKFGC